MNSEQLKFTHKGKEFYFYVKKENGYSVFFRDEGTVERCIVVFNDEVVLEFTAVAAESFANIEIL